MRDEKNKSGLILWRFNQKNKKIEYFLGKSCDVLSDTNLWGILKGGREGDETELENALREFREECLYSGFLHGGPLHAKGYPEKRINKSFLNKIKIKKLNTFYFNYFNISVFYAQDIRSFNEQEKWYYRSNEFEINGKYYPEITEWKYWELDVIRPYIGKKQNVILSSLDRKLQSHINDININSAFNYIEIHF